MSKQRCEKHGRGPKGEWCCAGCKPDQPSDTAMQAAREIVMPENLPLKLKKLRIDQVATRIDAAAEAIVRERLAAANEAMVCAEYALTHPNSNQTFAADALRDALKEIEGDK